MLTSLSKELEQENSHNYHIYLETGDTRVVYLYSCVLNVILKTLICQSVNELWAHNFIKQMDERYVLTATSLSFGMMFTRGARDVWMNPFKSKCTTAVKNARVNSAFCFCRYTSFLYEIVTFLLKSRLLLLHSNTKMVMWWGFRLSVAAQHALCWHLPPSSPPIIIRDKFFSMLDSCIQLYSKMFTSMKFIQSGNWVYQYRSKFVFHTIYSGQRVLWKSSVFVWHIFSLTNEVEQFDYLMALWKPNLLACALAAAVAFEVLNLWSSALWEMMVPLQETVLKIVFWNISQ
jgi:hypothetical protein